MNKDFEQKTETPQGGPPNIRVSIRVIVSSARRRRRSQRNSVCAIVKFTTAVLFDTSALRDAGWTSAPLLTLLELSKAGLVEVCLPELVTQERRTQWRERPKLAFESEKRFKNLLKMQSSLVITPRM